MSTNNKNPYARAAGAYDDNAKASAGNQRELEARILLKSNRMLQQLIDGWEDRPKDLLEETLKYNRQIWMLFYDTAIENKDGDRPSDLRSNIINLANFIFKREIEILAKPEKHKLDILISINREISAGLMANQKNEDTYQQTHQKESSSPQRTDISG